MGQSRSASVEDARQRRGRNPYATGHPRGRTCGYGFHPASADAGAAVRPRMTGRVNACVPGILAYIAMQQRHRVSRKEAAEP